MCCACIAGKFFSKTPLPACKFLGEIRIEEVLLANTLKEGDYKEKKEVNQQLGT